MRLTDLTFAEALCPELALLSFCQIECSPLFWSQMDKCPTSSRLKWKNTFFFSPSGLKYMKTVLVAFTRQGSSWEDEASGRQISCNIVAGKRANASWSMHWDKTPGRITCFRPCNVSWESSVWPKGRGNVVL